MDININNRNIIINNIDDIQKIKIKIHNHNKYKILLYLAELICTIPRLHDAVIYIDIKKDCIMEIPYYLFYSDAKISINNMEFLFYANVALLTNVVLSNKILITNHSKNDKYDLLLKITAFSHGEFNFDGRRYFINDNHKNETLSNDTITTYHITIPLVLQNKLTKYKYFWNGTSILTYEFKSQYTNLLTGTLHNNCKFKISNINGVILKCITTKCNYNILNISTAENALINWKVWIYNPNPHVIRIAFGNDLIFHTIVGYKKYLFPFKKYFMNSYATANFIYFLQYGKAVIHISLTERIEDGRNCVLSVTE
jgi:hypothetical protein